MAAADSYLALGESKQKFKLVRRYSYAGLGIIVLVMLVLTWLRYTGEYEGFYIPLPQMLFMILLGALVLNLASVVYSALEIYAASGGETRYLIARHGYSTGLVTAAFAAFFLIVFAVLGPVIDEQIDYNTSIELGVNSFGNTVTAPFNVSSDYTGASYLSWVEVDSTNGVLFTVTLFARQDYEPYCATANEGREILRAENVSHFRLSFVDHQVEVVPVANVTPESGRQWNRAAPYAEEKNYMIVLERHQMDRAVVVYHQNREIDPGFMNSAYIILILLIAVNAGAAVYNRIVRDKWRAYGEKNL